MIFFIFLRMEHTDEDKFHMWLLALASVGTSSKHVICQEPEDDFENGDNVRADNSSVTALLTAACSDTHRQSWASLTVADKAFLLARLLLLVYIYIYIYVCVYL